MTRRLANYAEHDGIGYVEARGVWIAKEGDPCHDSRFPTQVWEKFTLKKLANFLCRHNAGAEEARLKRPKS